MTLNGLIEQARKIGVDKKEPLYPKLTLCISSVPSNPERRQLAREKLTPKLVESYGTSEVALAEAAGFREVFRFDDPRRYAGSMKEILALVGPTFVHAIMEPGNEGPISRSEVEEARYLRPSLADSSRMLRAALAADRPT